MKHCLTIVCFIIVGVLGGCSRKKLGDHVKEQCAEACRPGNTECNKNCPELLMDLINFEIANECQLVTGKGKQEDDCRQTQVDKIWNRVPDLAATAAKTVGR